MDDNQTNPTTEETITSAPTVNDVIAPEAPETAPVAMASPSAETGDASPTQPASPSSVEQPSVTPAIAEHASGGKSHMVAIAVAVVVLLALLGGVGYIYTQNNSTAVKAPTGTTAKTEKPAATVAPVTAKDVDDTTKSVDESLESIDADKDFTINDLSDATLGL